MKKYVVFISCLLLIATTLSLGGCKSSGNMPMDNNQSNLEIPVTTDVSLSHESVVLFDDMTKEGETMANEKEITIPGDLSFDALIGCVNAWTSMNPEDGLSSYSEVCDEIQWLADEYITQYKKEVRAIQFENGDVLILMSTNNISNVDEYSQYLDSQTKGMAEQLHAKVDVDIDPAFTIIIISKGKSAVIKNAVNCAFTGRWPE